MIKSKTQTAFTLAEVLITLGVIGVVAALTMPTLVQNYKKHVVESKLKKFYTTMKQAELMSVNDNGPIEYWDWVQNGGTSNNEIVLNWYNKYFAPYLKTAEVIDKKKLDENDIEHDDGIVVMFSDGSIANFYNFSGGYMHIQYFINNKQFFEGTEVHGKDWFLFGIGHDKSMPNYAFDVYGGRRITDINTLKNNSWAGCYHSTSNRAYCTRLIQLNGWKIPDDYPYKF